MERKVMTDNTYHSDRKSAVGIMCTPYHSREPTSSTHLSAWAVGLTLDYHSHPIRLPPLPPPVPPSSDHVGKCAIPPLPHRGAILVGLTSGL